MSRIHFISGLPRSGSTLLAAILRQNPRFHASISSPVAQMFAAMQNQMSEQAEGSVFLYNERREEILRDLVQSYYQWQLYGGYFEGPKVFFDTNRLWTSKLDILASLFPDAKMIVMLRNTAWILDSIERLVRKNSTVPSRLFGCNPNMNVYGRVAQLMAPNGMVGYAYNNMREAFFSEHKERILFVRYESLAKYPYLVMADIARFIGVGVGDEWLASISQSDRAEIFPPLEQIPLAAEFDAKLGMPGLHHVAPSIQYQERETILPPDIFRREIASAFWETPELNTKGMTIL